MAALTITFAVSAPCAGDGHFDVTATQSTGGAVTIRRDKATWKRALTSSENELALELIVRKMISGLSGTTASAIATALEAKTLNLTLTG